MPKWKYEKSKLSGAIRLAIWTRWFYITALILTGVFSKLLIGDEASNQNFSSLSMLIMGLITYGLNFYYIYALKRYSEQGLSFISYFQLLVDTLVMIMIIYLAGGIISVSFVYLVYMIIISGFYYQDFKRIFLVTTLVSALYGGLIWGQYFGVLPYLPRYNNAFEFQLSRNLGAVVPNTFTIISTYYLVGIFIYSFAKSINEKESRLASEREKIGSILSNLVDGLLFFNSAGRLEMANKQAENLLGFSLAEVAGKNLIQINMSRYPALAQILRLPEGGRAFEFASPLAADVILKADKIDIHDGYKRFIGTAFLVRDVSREKFVDRMKSEFITIAGHQLRTPLSAIKGAVSLLKSGDYGPVLEDQKRVLEQVADYNERMIQLVNDFLNISSIEQGRSEFRLETVDISNLIREVAGSYADEAQEKLIRFTTEVKNDLNPLEVDPYKIKLALGGIINNAIAYTPKRGRVEIMAEFPDPGRVVISVTDSGIGIPRDQQGKVFGKFFRAENALRVKTEGNGLDLFVAKSIVETHKGKIWFKSQEGVGTTFFVELPTKI